MDDRWELRGDRITSLETDPRTAVTTVVFSTRGTVTVKGTRAVRCPSPLPSGGIVGASRVTTDEAAILTLVLDSGETVLVAGSGLARFAA